MGNIPINKANYYLRAMTTTTTTKNFHNNTILRALNYRSARKLIFDSVILLLSLNQQEIMEWNVALLEFGVDSTRLDWTEENKQIMTPTYFTYSF